MIVPMLLIALLAQGAEKQLPAVAEPDWNAFRSVKPDSRKEMAKRWEVLRKARPDLEYKDVAEEDAMRKRVDAAYEAIEKDPHAAFASGLEILRSTQDDFERLMIGGTLHDLDASKGESYLVWAMARSNSVDIVFSPMFQAACDLAERKSEQYLPAILLILKAREGREFLALHSWYIPTHECMFYVLGRFGKGVLPYLHPMLSHKDPFVRRNCAFALAYFGEAAAKPQLMKMLGAKDVASGGAAFALGELGVEEAVEAIAALLSAPDPDTRFWAAYSLYEIGSKKALPFLEKARAAEKDEKVAGEIDAAIEHLKGDARPFADGARKLNREELLAALEKAERENGIRSDLEEIAAIAASASHRDLERLESIRLLTLNIPSDLGNRKFRLWNEAIKFVRKRR